MLPNVLELDKFMEIFDSRLEKKQTQNKFQEIVTKKVKKDWPPFQDIPTIRCTGMGNKINKFVKLRFILNNYQLLIFL